MKRDAIEKAVTLIMEGEEAGEMRSEAKQLAMMATEAVKENGSSYTEFTALIEDLRLQKDSCG